MERKKRKHSKKKKKQILQKRKRVKRSCKYIAGNPQPVSLDVDGAFGASFCRPICTRTVRVGLRWGKERLACPPAHLASRGAQPAPIGFLLASRFS